MEVGVYSAFWSMILFHHSLVLLVVVDEFSLHVFEVLSSLGGALLGGVRDAHLAPRARHPVDHELEGADSLGDFHFVLGELNGRARALHWSFRFSNELEVMYRHLLKTGGTLRDLASWPRGLVHAT